MIKSDLTAAFCGCSRTVGAMSWRKFGEKNLMCYAANSSVAIFDFGANKTISLLKGHSAKINCVMWAPGSSHSILSASTDKTIRHWIKDEESWKLGSELKGHKEAVTMISCLELDEDGLLLASCSGDQTVKIWRFSISGWKLEQDISFSPRIAEALCLFCLPLKDFTPILAVASTDLSISLFVQVKNQFLKLLSLSGHEDWIRCISSVQTDAGEILLASSSQDSRVRIWKISEAQKTKEKEEQVFEESTHSFRVKGKVFHVFLESVLIGHEDWVLTAHWHPRIDNHQPIQLLTASMDRSMMIWEPDQESGVWTNSVHVGEVGGNTLGFFGGIFAPEGEAILANGYNGAFHLWAKQKGNDHVEWKPKSSMSGHFGAALDGAWHPLGHYFATVGDDQTTRIFAPWKESQTWHEIARAQVHGYDMTCISFLSDHSFVSGAEEKIVRVFAAPRTFLETLHHISQVDISQDNSNLIGASAHPLGLSNKPMIDDPEYKSEVSRFEFREPPAPKVHHEPPVEQYLFESTLWPEVHKLYGHPNEIVAVAANHKSSLIVSSCRATKSDQAQIRVWDTSTWKEKARLGAHTLTVVQFEFSHDDRFLLAVSRDRDFSVWDMEKLVCVQLVKGHERIIWSGSWSPDDMVIATGARDKLVKLWIRKNEVWTCYHTLTFAQPVTAVAFHPRYSSSNAYLLAVGLENGDISLVVHSVSAPEKDGVFNFSSSVCPSGMISRLCWRPQHDSQLLVVSQDHSVRLLTLSNLP